MVRNAYSYSKQTKLKPGLQKNWAILKNFAKVEHD